MQDKVNDAVELDQVQEAAQDENKNIKLLTEKIEIVERNNSQKEPDQYSGFEVSCERGEFGYLGRMWHHDYLELETAIMLANAGYPYIKLI